MEDLGCDLIGRAMGRIDNDLHALERECMVKGALAELDIAPCRVFKAPGLSQSGRVGPHGIFGQGLLDLDRKSTRMNSSHLVISYAVFCLKKKKKTIQTSIDAIYTYDQSTDDSL